MTGTVTITVRDAETGALDRCAHDRRRLERARRRGAARRPAARLSGTAQRRYGITTDGRRLCAGSASRWPIAAEPRELDVALAPLPAAVPEIVVTASRYELLREARDGTVLHRPTRDRAAARLRRRSAARAASLAGRGGRRLGQAHMRGGELNETAVVLNGQRLLDPFHIRDYQSMFSAIDARAIDGMEVYTGGFPVRYGDSMGALVLVDALDPQEPRHSELGLSVLNTSVLSAGTIGDGTGSWLVSGRRSNLEDVVHERLGEPSYYDFFGELGVNFSAAHAGFGQRADGARSTCSSSPKPTPPSSSNRPTTRATTRSGCTGSSSGRTGSRARRRSRAVRSTARAARQRTIPRRSSRPSAIGATSAIAGVRQDWQLDVGDAHTLSFGAEYQRQRADYDYSAAADYFGFFLTFPNVPATLRRSATLSPDGELFGAYVADRWQITAATTAELGLRFDRVRLHRHADGAAREPAHQRATRARPRAPPCVGRSAATSNRKACTSCRSRTASRRSMPAQRADQAVLGVEQRLGERYLHSRGGRTASRCTGCGRATRTFSIRSRSCPSSSPIARASHPTRRPRAASSSRSLTRSRTGCAGGRAMCGRARRTSSTAKPCRAAGTNATRRKLGVGHDCGPLGSRRSVSATTAGGRRRGSRSRNRRPARRQRSSAGATRCDSAASRASIWRASRSVPLRVGALDVFFEISNATNRDNPCCVDFDLEEDANGEFLEQETDIWLPRLATFGVLWQF